MDQTAVTMSRAVAPESTESAAAVNSSANAIRSVAIGSLAGSNPCG
jgi:hypothetical protein